MAKKKKLTNCEVVELIERKGDIGYALLNYIDPKEIKDPELSRLCKNAIIALQGIEAILENAEPVEAQ